MATPGPGETILARRDPAPTRIRAVVATVVSGVATALAFPTAGWEILAWVGLVPLLVVFASARPLRVLVLGTLWSLVFWVVIWNWGPSAVARFFGQSLLVGIGFLVATQGLLLLPWLLVFGFLHRALSRRFVLALPLLSAAAWVATDLARIRLFTGSDVLIGNPWAVIGYSQVDWLPVVQVASLVGVYGVSFVLVAANAALAWVWCRRSSPRQAGAVLGVGLAPGVLAAAWGAWVMEPAPPAATGTPVILVQGNLDVAGRWQPELHGRNLDTYLTLTREALALEPARIVFWPEAAMTFFVEEERGYRFSIGAAIGPTRDGAELVAGSPRRQPGSETVFYNSVFRLAPDGSLAGRYDKQLLLPFAEFSPWAGLDLRERHFGVREFSPGPQADPLATRAGLAGILVCNEIGFSSLAHARVAAGATYLVNPANDGWVGDPQYSEQMFQIARMRAVEERRTLVRPSTAGPSAIVDPWGRVQVRSEPFTRTTLSGVIHARFDRTFYSRVGDAFALLCAVAVALALATGRPGHGARAPAPD